LTTLGVPVTVSQYLEQFDGAISRHDLKREGIREIDIFNSGNFLNEAEIPAEAQVRMIERCARQEQLRVILIESRPEYITTARLSKLRGALRRSRDMALDVAIGLDAYNDLLRERVLRKGFTRAAFERAVHRLADSGFGLVSYVMLKPWAIPDEAALRDAIDAAAFVYETARSVGVRTRVALEPTFVVPGTPLAGEYLRGRYRPPSLWLVRSAAENIAQLGPLSVGLWDEDLRPLAVPSSCDGCRSRLIDALSQFNLTQNRSFLQVGDCSCRQQ
jgi:radical SAM enzyme (TIGR01210 family)